MQRINENRDPETQATLWQGHRPSMATAAVALLRAVYKDTTLSFREAEAARIRISHINGCVPCTNFRVSDGLSDLLARLSPSGDADVVVDRGASPTPEFYDSISEWRESSIYSVRERLSIEYAELISEEPRDLPYNDEFWARMSQAYDDGEIVDLTYSITTWIATGRFVHVLGLDSVCPTFEISTQSAMGGITG